MENEVSIVDNGTGNAVYDNAFMPAEIWLEIDYSDADTPTAPLWSFSDTPEWAAVDWASTGKTFPEAQDLYHNMAVGEDPIGECLLMGSTSTLQLMIGFKKLVSYYSVTIHVEGRSASVATSVIFDVYNPVTSIGVSGSLDNSWAVHTLDLTLGPQRSNAATNYRPYASNQQAEEAAWPLSGCASSYMALFGKTRSFVLVYNGPLAKHAMLTESDLQTPEWLAAIASGQSIIIRGHVGEHRLEGLRAILPLGAFQWVPIDLPPGEALDAEFFSSILASLPGEVPRKVFALPVVAPPASLDALAEVRATRPWVQWVAVVPDPEINPVLPDGILLFDAKTRQFLTAEGIPGLLLEWATDVLTGTRTEAERQHAATSEGPKILTTITAIAAADYSAIGSITRGMSKNRITAIASIAGTIASLEGVDTAQVAAEIEETTTIVNTISPAITPSTRNLTLQPPSMPAPAPPGRSKPRPLFFEAGKALPMYAPGDPIGKYAVEMDAVRRDPEAYAALLELLQEIPCRGDLRDQCAAPCNDPAQQWACLRDNIWSNGMPSAITDRWLDLFARLVARAGRRPREAYSSFATITQHAAVTPPTVSSPDFVAMANEYGSPAVVSLPDPPTPIPPKISQKSVPQSPPSLMKPTLIAIAARSHNPRARIIAVRLEELAARVNRLKAHLTSQFPVPEEFSFNMGENLKYAKRNTQNEMILENKEEI